MMGIISSVYERFFGKPKNMRVLILGLNGGVGKTTVLYRLKEGTTVNTMHTVGFNLETVQHNNINLDVWDIGGGDKITALWHQYYPDTKSVIFVIDSTDKERVKQVEFELSRLLNAKELENVPFLLLANKQDKPDAMTLDELKTALNLDNWKNRSIHLQSTVASEGKGLTEGMNWLCAELSKQETSFPTNQ